MNPNTDRKICLELEMYGWKENERGRRVFSPWSNRKRERGDREGRERGERIVFGPTDLPSLTSFPGTCALRRGWGRGRGGDQAVPARTVARGRSST